jgi:hypothetical protein
MCERCVFSRSRKLPSLIPMPSWLPAVLTIADFIAQRVDKAGSVSFEPPEKQPPERARTTAPAETTAAAASEGTTEGEDAPMGFDPVNHGGGNDPTPAGPGGGGSEPEEDDDDDDGSQNVRCSFRSMRVKDRPTTYEA